MKIDLEKELKESRQEKVDHQDALIDVSRQLLENNAQTEINIIRNLGIDKNLQRADKATGINLERNELETKYKGEVFTEDEIKSLCMQYRLRFLPAELYTGVVDNLLGPKLRAFSEEHKLGMENHFGSKDDFMLMAPPTHFRLTKKVKPKITFQTDPLLFYKVGSTKENTYYKLVHKWGNDFTIRRLIYGFGLRTRSHYFLTNWFYAATLMFIIGGFANWNTPQLFLTSILLGGAISAGLLLGATDRTTEWAAFSDKYWDSDQRV